MPFPRSAKVDTIVRKPTTMHLHFGGTLRNAEHKSCQPMEKIVTKKKWNVTEAKPMPIWDLEFGSVQIDASPNVVSSRIDDCLRNRSIQVKFDSKNAEAHCITGDCLHYNIYLYAGKNNSTFVEILRQRGCGFQFRSERRAVLDSANEMHKTSLVSKRQRSFEVPSEVKNLCKRTRRFEIPAELKAMCSPPSKSELENELERLSDEMHSNRRETVLVALQNLVCMTNNAPATDACNLIMLSTSCQILDAVLAIYDSESKKELRDIFSDQVCYACLETFQNVLASFVKNNSHGVLDLEKRSLMDKLIPSLFFSIQGDKLKHSHQAYCALRCLSLLVDNSQFACARIRDLDTFHAMEQAIAFGSREHMLLEKTAMIIQNKLIVS